MPEKFIYKYEKLMHEDEFQAFVNVLKSKNLYMIKIKEKF